MRTEEIERLARAAHRGYCKAYLKNTGKEYWTGGDYDKLDEKTKEIDRIVVIEIMHEYRYK